MILGVDASPDKIIGKAIEVNADIIGMSAVIDHYDGQAKRSDRDT